MFGETTISYVKIGNHPIETTIYKWLFGVPGWYMVNYGDCLSLYGDFYKHNLPPLLLVNLGDYHLGILLPPRMLLWV